MLGYIFAWWVSGFLCWVCTVLAIRDHYGPALWA